MKRSSTSSIVVLLAGMFSTATFSASLADHHHHRHHGPLHGPGSSHNPIAYRPVHGPGSSHTRLFTIPCTALARVTIRLFVRRPDAQADIVGDTTKRQNRDERVDLWAMGIAVARHIG
jgi:hypothetical protein